MGQSSANDNNQNLKYPTLDARIAKTYAGKSTAANKNSLYDSYLRAFRWATDRIGDRGVVAFVSNGGWIEANTGDGVRLSMAEDFSHIYVFNLRGNTRTSGELARREGGQTFGSGSRNTIAITIGVKDPAATGCSIHYRDIGDYLTAEEKLHIVDRSSPENLEWTSITPNSHGDWINQRNEDFATWPVLADRKKLNESVFFNAHSRGLSTARDAWCYNYSKHTLEQNIRRLIDIYNETRLKFHQWAKERGLTKLKETDVTSFLTAAAPSQAQEISWNRSLKQQCARNNMIEYSASNVRLSIYRPGNRQYCYFDRAVNDMVYRLPSMFPTPAHDNVGIEVSGASSPTGWSALATPSMPDVQLLGNGQFFPRWTWEPVQAPEGELDLLNVQATTADDVEAGCEGEIRNGYRRVDNISDQILTIYRDALGKDISKDDIFSFVYGQLHDPSYRETYAADLKKMLPHIATPTSKKRFDQLAEAGRKLMDLHVNYESLEPWPLELEWSRSADPSAREAWRVQKMKWARVREPETNKLVNDTTKIIYNKQLTISGIPEDAERYQLGSRSALAWIIDRYQVKIDKASGIVNDPNDWADEHDNPKYIIELIGKVTRVAVETMKIVESLKEA